MAGECCVKGTAFGIYRCRGCKRILSGDDVVWARASGVLDVMEGYPWCHGCLPEEPPEGAAYIGVEK